jgi:predicted ester cyclase
MILRRLLALTGGFALFFATIAAIFPGGFLASTPASATDLTKTRVRVVHAIPEVDKVDVYVDANGTSTTPTISDLDFFTVTNYLEVPSGTYQVRVFLANEDPTHSTPAISTSVTLIGGRSYSVVANRSAGNTHTLSAQLVDNNNAAPDFGKSRVRVAHFSPNAPAVDIFIDGKREITNLSYRSVTPYLTLPGGSYQVGVAPAGGNPIFTTSLVVQSGQVITAWANGLLGGSSGQAFTVTPSIDSSYSGKARIRAIHAVPDIAGTPVDLFVNGQKVTTFDFFSNTPYLDIYPFAHYDIQVRLAGNTVIQNTLTFQPNSDNTIVARGTAATNDSAALGATALVDNNSAPEAGKAKVRVAHFSPNAPAVDIFIAGKREITKLNYLSATGYLTVPPGDYEVGVAPAGGNPIFTTTLTLKAGQVATAFANGLLGSSGAQAFKVTPTIDAEFAQARIRAIHAVPDIAGSPVDVLVNGQKVTTFDFFSNTPYLPVLANTPTNIKVQLNGTTVIEGNLSFQPNTDNTIVARGTAAAGDSAALGATALVDNNSAPEAGKAKVRVAHFSPNAPAVDVFIAGNREITNLNYLSATGYLTVPPGDYVVGVAPTGGSPIFTTTLTLKAGQVATAFANGLLGSSGAQAFKVTPTIDAEFAQARIRAIHAVPDIAGSPVDVLVNGQKVTTFDFFSNTPYLPVLANTPTNIKVQLNGTTVIEGDLSFEPNSDNSIVARGTAAASDSAALGASALVDNNAAPEAGKAKVRVAHFSPDAPAVDVFIAGTRTITNLNYLSATGYLTVPPGDYVVGVAPAGGNPIFTTTLTLKADQVATAWANGLLGGSGAQAFKVTPTIDAEFGSTMARFLHAAPNAPAVDVFLNGTRVTNQSSFGTLTNKFATPTGDVTVEVKPAGSNNAVFTGKLSLKPGKQYTIAAIGTLAAQSASLQNTGTAFNVIAIEDDNTVAVNKSRVRVVHLSPNTGAVDLRVGGQTLIDDLAYGSSRYIEVAAGTVAYQVTTADGSQVALSGNVVLNPNSVTSVFVIGLSGSAPEGQQLRALPNVDVAGASRIMVPMIVR